jgi:hypothetical protein
MSSPLTHLYANGGLLVETCCLDTLNDRESYWVNKLDAMNPAIGYNLKSGGNQNITFSKESKLKMSESAKGKPKKTMSEEHRRKLSEWQKGKPKRPHSEITKKRMSEAWKTRILSTKTHTHSEETKRKIKQSNSGRKNLYLVGKKTPEHSKLMIYNNPNAKSVLYEGVVYNTKKEMMLKTGISLYNINKFIKNNLAIQIKGEAP